MVDKNIDKIYFEYERMEPKQWPEPRNVRSQLEYKMIGKYKDKPISDITLSTEIILKVLKLKNGIEKPLLKYKVINLNWENTRSCKDKFTSKMFKFQKKEELDMYENTGVGDY